MTNTVELSDEGPVHGGEPNERNGDARDPLLGRRLLHYRIDEQIGEGGMSVVYRGTDENLHRPVAIKVLHPFLAKKPECRERLAREARAVARLEHENIVRVFDFSGSRRTERAGERDRTDGFLVTELVMGTTLRQFAKNNSIWKVPEIGALCVWQLADALQHAHDQGVVHRDLKPENVMVRDDGALKLMDFGIAQVVDSKSLTVTGTLLGSPAHMAPECIEGKPADERSDVFSLGTVLYWLCTGRLPFDHTVPHALLRAIVEGSAQPVQQANPRVSDALARVLRKAMSTNVDDRYTSARDFASALDDVLTPAGLSPTPDLVQACLRDDDGGLERVSPIVYASYIESAKQLLTAGEKNKAYSVLSRILSEFPDDGPANALIDRAEPLPPSPDPTSSTDEQNESRAARGKRRTPLFIGGAVLAAVSATGIWTALPTGTNGDADLASKGDRASMAGLDVAEPPMNIGQPDFGDPATAAPATKTERTVEGAPSANLRLKNKGRRRAVLKAPGSTVAGRAQRLPAVQKKTGESAPEGEARSVDISVNGFATIIVDGDKKYPIMRKGKIDLTPGQHSLRVENQAAVTATYPVKIPKSGQLKPIIFQLKPKPALLRVFADFEGKQMRGDVFVHSARNRSGPVRLAGTTTESQRRALPVYFAGGGKTLRGTEKFEITVKIKGHPPWTTTMNLTAGRSTDITVHLE